MDFQHKVVGKQLLCNSFFFVFVFLSQAGLDREKSKLTVASAVENASDSDKNSKSATKKLAEKVERFKQSRKSHSETRIVGGVAINTVGNNTPLSVQSSAVSVKSESELDNIQNKVLHLFFYHFLPF